MLATTNDGSCGLVELIGLLAIGGPELVPVCTYVGQHRFNHCGAADLSYGGVPVLASCGSLQWHARMLP